jgi:hypothetical protein
MGQQRPKPWGSASARFGSTAVHPLSVRKWAAVGGKPTFAAVHRGDGLAAIVDFFASPQYGEFNPFRIFGPAYEIGTPAKPAFQNGATLGKERV